MVQFAMQASTAIINSTLRVYVNIFGGKCSLKLKRHKTSNLDEVLVLGLVQDGSVYENF